MCVHCRRQAVRIFMHRFDLPTSCRYRDPPCLDARSTTVLPSSKRQPVVVRDRIELSTFRFSGAIEVCLGVAGRRLTANLPAPIVAGRRPVSPGVCLRWLPVWLPHNSVSCAKKLSHDLAKESGLARRRNQSAFRQADQKTSQRTNSSDYDDRRDASPAVRGQGAHVRAGQTGPPAASGSP